MVHLSDGSLVRHLELDSGSLVQYPGVGQVDRRTNEPSDKCSVGEMILSEERTYLSEKWVMYQNVTIVGHANQFVGHVNCRKSGLSEK